MRRTHRAVMLAVALALLAAAPAGAQALQPAFTMTVDVPEVLAVAPGTSTVVVHWVYSLDDPASAPFAFTIAWSSTCPVGLTPATTPGQWPGSPAATVEGTTELAVAVSVENRAALLNCPILASVTADPPGDAAIQQAAGEAPLEAAVAFAGNLSVSAPVTHKQAGPQKAVRYDIELANKGNLRLMVESHLAKQPGDGWNAVVPSPVVLDPGDRLVMTFLVSTPFENGYNDKGTSLGLRLSSKVPGTDQPGPSTTLEFDADVTGWYAPGPALPLAVLGLAGVAGATRRSR